MALFRLLPSSQRKTCRHRKGETHGGFRQAARHAMHRTIAQTAEAFLWDTLAWLNLWDWNDPASANETCDSVHDIDQHDHLSLHL